MTSNDLKDTMDHSDYGMTLNDSRKASKIYTDIPIHFINKVFVCKELQNLRNAFNMMHQHTAF